MQRAPLIHNPLLSRQRFLQLTAAGAAGAATLGTGLATHASGRTSAPKRGGILRLGQVGDVKSFDGPIISDNNSIWTMLLIYDQLTRPTADGLSIEPSLAKSWDISPDGKTYTFHLRTGVKFHDGSPLTADGRQVLGGASGESARTASGRSCSVPSRAWRWWIPTRCGRTSPRRTRRSSRIWRCSPPRCCR